MGRVPKDAGFWVADAAAVAWIVAAFEYSLSTLVVVGFAVLGGGLGLVAIGIRTGGARLSLAGSIVAVLGVVPFVADVVTPFAFGVALVALGLYVLGLAAVAAASIQGLRLAQGVPPVPLVVAGALVAAAGGLRVYSDWAGGEYWQFGNALTLLGGLLLLFGKARPTKAT